MELYVFITGESKPSTIRRPEDNSFLLSLGYNHSVLQISEGGKSVEQVGGLGRGSSRFLSSRKQSCSNFIKESRSDQECAR